MKLLIIEDEKPAAQKLIRQLRNIEDSFEILGPLNSVEEAVNWFHNNSYPDLVFMDIQLEDGICFEIYEQCDINVPVVFTTAYNEYTLKAFKVNSVDYLLKPIDVDDLKAALNKYRIVHHNIIDYKRMAETLMSKHSKKKERFFIKVGEHYKSVNVSSIDYFFICERCNFMHVAEDKEYPVDYSFDKIEQMLDMSDFFRVNRNFIVNIKSIEDIISYSSSRLKIIVNGWKNNEEILVSRERVAEFKIWMDR